MDPDACFNEILQLLSELTNGIPADAAATLTQAAEHAQDLKDWIDKDGFLPSCLSNDRAAEVYLVGICEAIIKSEEQNA